MSFIEQEDGLERRYRQHLIAIMLCRKTYDDIDKNIVIVMKQMLWAYKIKNYAEKKEIVVSPMFPFGITTVNSLFQIQPKESLFK